MKQLSIIFKHHKYYQSSPLMTELVVNTEGNTFESVSLYECVCVCIEHKIANLKASQVWNEWHDNSWH